MQRIFLRLFSLIILTFILSACNLPSFNNKDSQTNSSSTTTTTATTNSMQSTPTPIPAVSTDCPADGTARAAVMPPLPNSNHPNVIYFSNDVQLTNGHEDSVTSTISRYDTITKQKTDIYTVTLKDNPSSDQIINNPRISDDGQWIAFQTVVNGKTAIQMERADGKELQTLYCSTDTLTLRQRVSFSPSTKYLSISITNSQTNSKQLQVIELATGTILTVNQIPISESAEYDPIKWRDDNSLYLNHTLNGVGITRNRHKIYLQSDIKNPTSLQEITIPTIPNGSNDLTKDFDFSPDKTQMLVSDSTPDPNVNHRAFKGPSTIELVPTSGDTSTPHIVYQDPTKAIMNARFIDKTTILFTAGGTDENQKGLWKINTDGTHLQHLTSKAGYFADLSYSTRMNLSLNGQTYALLGESENNDTRQQSIWVGSLNGNDATSIATIDFHGGLIGWTSL